MRLHLGPLTRLYAYIDPDAEVVRGTVEAWRHWLNKELPHALHWDESPTAPFEIAEVGDWDRLIGGGPDQLIQPDIWLPGDHDFLFVTQDLAEDEIRIGSSAELLDALKDAPECPGKLTLARLVRRSQQFRLPLAKVYP
jgi:hypothetical protein